MRARSAAEGFEGVVSVDTNGLRAGVREVRKQRVITVRDDASGEDRWVTIGMEGRILVAVYAFRGRMFLSYNH